MQKNNKKLKIAAVVIFFFFMGASAVQAVVVKNNNENTNLMANDKPITTQSSSGGSIFTWEDDFLDWSKIDSDKSSNIEIQSNKVVMKHTYKAWHWQWPNMKEINIQNSGSAKSNYVLYLDKVYKTPEMESDYSDLRFVSVDGSVVLACALIRNHWCRGGSSADFATRVSFHDVVCYP